MRSLPVTRLLPSKIVALMSLAAVAIAAMLSAAAAESLTLRIRVDGFRSEAGQVFICLWENGEIKADRTSAPWGRMSNPSPTGMVDEGRHRTADQMRRGRASRAGRPEAKLSGADGRSRFQARFNRKRTRTSRSTSRPGAGAGGRRSGLPPRPGCDLTSSNVRTADVLSVGNVNRMQAIIQAVDTVAALPSLFQRLSRRPGGVVAEAAC